MGPWDGVGDCAARLGEALRERHGVSSRFIEAGGAHGRAAFAAGVGQAEAGSALLLHYVGYGYAKRGAPLWLARAFARAGGERSLRLGVFFHELYATGRPWQSSFWLSGLQKHIVTRIAGDCHAALLTREANRQWLEATGALADKPVSVLPVSSNVGEPAQVQPFHERPAALAVWGSAQARATVYGRLWARVAGACRQLGVPKIVDIGAPVTLPADGAVTIEARGRLPAAALSRALLEARFGLLAYPASSLAKSSIFAAYAAHGIVPVVIDDARTPDMDGLVAGRNFLRFSPQGIESSGASHEGIARLARDWYAGHTTAAHADAVMRLFAGVRA